MTPTPRALEPDARAILDVLTQQVHVARTRAAASAGETASDADRGRHRAPRRHRAARRSGDGRCRREDVSSRRAREIERARRRRDVPARARSAAGFDRSSDYGAAAVRYVVQRRGDQPSIQTAREETCDEAERRALGEAGRGAAPRSHAPVHGRRRRPQALQGGVRGSTMTISPAYARTALVASLFIASSFAPAVALAAGPDTQTCIKAFDDGQRARSDGHLRAAREKLLLCSQKECPGVLREDCAGVLREVDLATPTIVPAASDRDGKDLAEVEVTLAGQTIATRLEGRAVPATPVASSSCSSARRGRR